MLVLSRKVNEELVIDRQIRVRLLGASRGRVRLGIEAPREVDIKRAELGPGACACEIGEKGFCRAKNIKK